MSTDGHWQKELSKEISKEQYLALAVVLFPFTNRAIKRLVSIHIRAYGTCAPAAAVKIRAAHGRYVGYWLLA